MDNERAGGRGPKVDVVVFPNVTSLDLIGPVEVLRRLPGAAIRYVARELTPVALTSGVFIHPDVSFRSAHGADVVLVPGGEGVNQAMQDSGLKSFLTKQTESARYVTSVCTGSLVLGAAGLLRGKRATSHWLSIHQLERFGAVPVEERVVVDGNLVTAAGVSAGIDLAFVLVRLLSGREASDSIQLAIEYDPDPPADLSELRKERPDLEQRVADRLREVLDERSRIIESLSNSLGPEVRP